MIVRALFWIAVVIVLMPAETGLGDSGSAPAAVAEPVGMFRSFVHETIDRVRIDIARSERARGEHVPHF